MTPDDVARGVWAALPTGDAARNELFGRVLALRATGDALHLAVLGGAKDPVRVRTISSTERVGDVRYGSGPAEKSAPALVHWLSADGARVMWSVPDGTWRETREGGEERAIDGTAGWSRADVSRDGSTLLLQRAENGRRARLRVVRNGIVRRDDVLPPAPIAALSRDGRYVIHFDTERARWTVVDLETDRATSFEGVGAPTRIIASPRDDTVVIHGRDRRLSHVDLATGKVLRGSVADRTSSLLGVGGDRALVIERDAGRGRLACYDLRGTGAHPLSPGVFQSAISDDGRFVWSLRDGRLTREGVDDGRTDRWNDAHDGLGLSLAWSRDGAMVATLCDRGVVRVSRVGDPSTVWTFEGAPTTYGALAFSPDLRWLYALGPRVGLVAWDLATGMESQRVASLAQRVSSLTASPDGAHLLALQPGIPPRCIDVTRDTRKATALGRSATVRHGAFADDGRVVALEESAYVATRLQWYRADGTETESAAVPPRDPAAKPAIWSALCVDRAVTVVNASGEFLDAITVAGATPGRWRAVSAYQGRGTWNIRACGPWLLCLTKRVTDPYAVEGEVALLDLTADAVRCVIDAPDGVQTMAWGVSPDGARVAWLDERGVLRVYGRVPDEGAVVYRPRP